MAFFSWQDRYAVDIESVDNDHKKLVGMIDDLYTAMSQGKAKNIVQDIVKDLVDYTKVHFRREEVYMKSTGYREFDEHKKEHDAFVEKVDAFQSKLNSGRDNISIEIITFLRGWLTGHILNTDKKFVPELKKYGIK